ncbi:hypothetical protein DFQ28_010554 [Apophysomyces sp. BC1034]|nr:hypothetical protein DFQ29_002583 [Apophysomyces sp. BC1021]KAG0194470.1 hypothetical protein DFQ28_010554 [Apophysomyces sp. BC1034]
MNALAGLVNYSDDEDQVSEEEIEKQPVKSPTPPTISAPVENVSAPCNLVEQAKKKEQVLLPAGSEVEKSRRLKALLAPKPIEGVKNWGIPPEPDTPVDPARAEKMNHFLSLRASGHRLNTHLQRNKAFRNPRIYAKLVEFVELDEFGSNFSKEEFDPHGYPSSAYIDQILETQRRMAEEKAMAQQQRTNISFVGSGNSNIRQHPDPSSAMATAMATAARVASRIAMPPHQLEEPSTESKKRPSNSKWDVHEGREKRHK